MRAATAGVITVLAGMLLGLAGCASDPTAGYSFSSSYDNRVQSIAIDVFENDTYHPGLESDLTTAIIRRVQRDTPWNVTGSDAAQTHLTGVIRDVRIQRLTQDTAGGITQQAAVGITVEFTWRNRVTGRELARRTNLTVTESFIPAAGEPLEIGLAAAADEMAGAILEAMRSVW
ncbi:MAG: LptE family protein [Phycisphaerales bacterium JB060]